LAPLGAPKKVVIRPAPSVGNTAEENDPMSDKFKRVMDWGTPRIVTKNRMLAMDPKQL